MSPEKFPHRGLNSLLIYEMSNVIHLEIGSQAVSATPPIVEMLTFWSLVCKWKRTGGFYQLKVPKWSFVWEKTGTGFPRVANPQNGRFEDFSSNSRHQSRKCWHSKAVDAREMGMACRSQIQIHKYTNTQIHKYKYTNTNTNIQSFWGIAGFCVETNKQTVNFFLINQKYAICQFNDNTSVVQLQRMMIGLLSQFVLGLMIGADCE